METQAQVTMVTPEMASEWLTAYHYEHQRDLRQAHVRFLAEEMNRKSFKQDTVIEFCKVGDAKFLTDGRHRLSAVAWSKLSQRFIVVERTLADEDAVAVDYTRTDKGKRRTVADDYRTLSIEEELGVTATQANNLGSACVLILNDFRSTAQSKIHSDDRLRMMREYGDAMGDYLEVLAGSSADFRHRLMRAATLGVALVTFRFSSSVYSKPKVEEFWKGVAFDDGLRATDPRKIANRHLLEVGMVGGAAMSPKVASVAYSSRYLASCFNAYIDDRSLNFTKVLDTAKPISIKGSPFSGK